MGEDDFPIRIHGLPSLSEEIYNGIAIPDSFFFEIISYLIEGVPALLEHHELCVRGVNHFLIAGHLADLFVDYVIVNYRRVFGVLLLNNFDLYFVCQVHLALRF
jgi:hypothetical protein